MENQLAKPVTAHVLVNLDSLVTIVRLHLSVQVDIKEMNARMVGWLWE